MEGYRGPSLALQTGSCRGALDSSLGGRGQDMVNRDEGRGAGRVQGGRLGRG